MSGVKRRPEPAFPPAVMQRLALSAVVACAIAFALGLVLASSSDLQPIWLHASWLAILIALAGWNLRTYRQLRSGAHWSQQADASGSGP